MNKIKGKSKFFYIFFGAVDILLAITTILLIILSVIFGGSLAPEIFSNRIYLMDTDAFSLVENGSALIARDVKYNEIVPGNIVLFSDENEKTRIGEVQQSKSENGVYTFTVKNDADSLITVGQSHILGKGIYYSKIIGMIISFVTSPAGICCIAVLPCAAFVIFEFLGAARKKEPLPNVQTVKKQDEIPTFIPNYAQTEKGVGGNIPIEERPAFSGERQKLMEAAGLYNPSPKNNETINTVPERKPVLEKDIDKLIRETKARHKNDAFMSTKDDVSPTKGSAPMPYADTKSSAAKIIYEQMKNKTQPQTSKSEYNARPEPPMYTEGIDRTDTFERNESVPHREQKRPSSRVSPRVSRLDSLLKEESVNSRYDINDILKNIDK